MHLLINGYPQAFTDLKAFRAAQHLPESFGVNWFEPKDYTGLGRIDHAGAELNHLKNALLGRLPPPTAPLPLWLMEQPNLQAYFRDQLEAINAVVGLRDPEIDFAAAGFGDVLQAAIYAALRARSSGDPLPTFEQIYMVWLNDTVRVASHQFEYAHQGENWHIQLVSHAYGRVGLIIHTPQQTHYVADHRLACPAEGFMVNLLKEVTASLLGNL